MHALKALLPLAFIAALFAALSTPGSSEDTRDWKAYSWGNQDLSEIGNTRHDCAVKRDRCLREQAAIDACFVEYCNLQHCYCENADYYGSSGTAFEGSASSGDIGLVPVCSPRAAVYSTCAEKAEQAAAAERLDRTAQAELARLTTPPASPPRSGQAGFADQGAGSWGIPVPEGSTIRFKVIQLSGARQYLAVSGGGAGIPPDQWSGRARVDGILGAGGEKPGTGTMVTFQMFHQRAGGTRFYPSVMEPPRQMGPGHYVLRAFNPLAARHAEVQADVARMRGVAMFANLLAQREAELATYEGRTTEAYEMLVEITLEQVEQIVPDSEYDMRVPEPDRKTTAIARTPLPGGAPRCGWDDAMRVRHEEPCWEMTSDGRRRELFLLADGTKVARTITDKSISVSWIETGADGVQRSPLVAFHNLGTVAQPRLDGPVYYMTVRVAQPGQASREVERHGWNAEGTERIGNAQANTVFSFRTEERMCGARRCETGRLWNYDPASKRLEKFTSFYSVPYAEYEAYFDSRGQVCREIRTSYDQQGNPSGKIDSFDRDGQRCD